MTTVEVPFSQLLRESTSVVAKLEQPEHQRVKLIRRDGEDLILESADRAEAEADAVTMTTRLFVALMKHDVGAQRLLQALPEVFPWVRFLSAAEVREFLVEFVQTAHACAELDSLVPVETTIAAWRHTAEVKADPELRRALDSDTSDAYDGGPVPPPDDR